METIAYTREMKTITYTLPALVAVVFAACVPYGNRPEDIAAYDVQLVVEHARATWDAEFGPSDDFYLSIGKLDHFQLGKCKAQLWLELLDPELRRTVTLDVDQLADPCPEGEKQKYPSACKDTEAWLYAVALHEIVHVNTTCSDRDHNDESFLMDPFTGPRNAMRVREWIDQYGWDYPALAGEIFYNVDREYVARWRR